MDSNFVISQIKESVNSATEYIAEVKDSNITDALFQIKKINATINELKKNNIPVPSELTNLKLSLSSQIDKVNDGEKLRKELIGILEAFISDLKAMVSDKNTKKRSEKEKVKKIVIQERVNLIEFITTAILPSGVEFYAYYKNKRYSATLLNNGMLEMLMKNKKKHFENPRSAANAITGYQVDPWKFWRLDFEGKPLVLDDYRKIYLKKKQRGALSSAIEDNDVVAE